MKTQTITLIMRCQPMKIPSVKTEYGPGTFALNVSDKTGVKNRRAYLVAAVRKSCQTDV